MKFCKLITKYDIAVKLAIKKPKMAANIVCYYNFANKQGIKMLLPVVINKIGEREKKRRRKKADCHSSFPYAVITVTSFAVLFFLVHFVSERCARIVCAL